MPLSLYLISPNKLPSTTVYKARKPSVCLSVYIFCVTMSAFFNTGLAQHKSCIFWNMQDYVYNFTGMIVLQPGLKLGWVIRVIQVNRVMFCPDKAGLTMFIKMSWSDPDSALYHMH